MSFLFQLLPEWILEAHGKGAPFLTGVEWIQDDVITLFTTDGLVRIGGSIRPSNEVGLLY